MQTSLDNNPITKRPNGLTILCVFSFIGIAYSILSSVFSMATSSSILDSFYDLEAMYPDKKMLHGLSLYATKIEIYGNILLILELIFNFFCLAGVIMMWKLKRNGYFIYLAAEISPIIVYLILIGFVSFIPDIILAVNAFIAVLFSLLYATKLRYLR